MDTLNFKPAFDALSKREQSKHTIGFLRHDGDLQVIATTNNHDTLIDPDKYAEYYTKVLSLTRHYFGPHDTIIGLERDDAPDYVTPDDEDVCDNEQPSKADTAHLTELLSQVRDHVLNGKYYETLPEDHPHILAARAAMDMIDKLEGE